MKAEFAGLKWNKGDVFVRQGIKHGYQPKNAVGGGNGSWVCTIPASLILTLVDKNGKYHRFNIISIVKGCNDWNKLSEKRVSKLKQRLKDEGTFDIDKDTGYIKRLEQILTL